LIGFAGTWRVRLRKKTQEENNMNRSQIVAIALSGMALSLAAQTPERHIYRAKATLKGSPGSGIAGVVTLTQTKSGVVSEVLIEAQITGLRPGAQHGMHIHEVGSCSDVNPVNGSAGAFLGAGGHFDPGPNSNSNADANHPFHMGDVPNVEVNELGVGNLKHRTSRITLSPGPLTVFDPDDPATAFNDTDSAIILHANPDQGTTGVTGGAGGPRIACGVIERVSGWEEVKPPQK
jgi:Cu-Zn family superoxide dismutase